MRVKVVAAKATEVAHGPGRFMIRNKTAGVPVFYETGSRGPTPAEEPHPLATEAAGWEVAAGAVLEVSLGPEESLTAIVKTAGAEQELELLRTSPKL